MRTPNFFFIALSLSFVFGCTQDSASNSNKEKISPLTEPDSIVHLDNSAVVSKNWIDSVLEKYLLLSDNKLVRQAMDNKGSDHGSEEWLYDQALDDDTAQ